MTKDVLVAIRGLQFDGLQDDGSVEVITPGDYYKRNDKHYIIYEEHTEGVPQSTQNVMKFNKDGFDLTKKGAVNVHMVFEENKKNITNYGTPFGNIIIGIDTKKIHVSEGKERIRVDIDYALEVNYEHLADCKIAMDIQPKEQAVLFAQ